MMHQLHSTRIFVTNLARLHSTHARHLSTEWTSDADYVVVGGGSAGCVLADRLSESGDATVTLLEAGKADSWWRYPIHMPAALVWNIGFSKTHNWYYWTEAQEHMNNRAMYWPRGKVLGGSSALNAMVYMRGHALDYDRWHKEGATGWSYADCLPYFKKSQSSDLGEDNYRGADGPLHTTRGEMKSPLFRAFLEAGQQAGYPYTDDCNGYQQEGFSPFDMTIYKGKRWSASQAYLSRAKDRPNLRIITGALASKVCMNGTKAEGVEYFQQGHAGFINVERVKANKELILCGGAINSPQLLQLSGIGDPEELRKHGIPCVLPLPGVGRNLQDHLEVIIQYKCTQPVTLYNYLRPSTMLFTGSKALGEWFINKSGHIATSSFEVGAFFKSNSSAEHADVQLHFIPCALNSSALRSLRMFPDDHSYQAHVATLRATSKGTVALKNADPRQHPRIQPNYLSTTEDVVDLRNAVKLTREILSQMAFDEFRGAEIQPKAEVRSDADIDAFVREKGETLYHPSGTCAMGANDDEMAVTDPETRVRGADCLRVVDASIMPSIISGNLNAPVMMMAEKAADMIKGLPQLPKSDASFHCGTPGVQR